MTGRIVSIKMNRTVAVVVTNTVTHPLYKKSFTRSKKYLADDQLGVKMGDIVELEKIRPISKRKHWKVVKVVGRNIEEIVSEQLKEAAKKQISEIMPEEEETEVANETQEEKIEEEEKPKGGKRGKSIK